MDFTYVNIFSDDVREIIAAIGQENIFKLIFEDVSLSKSYCSPFREDKNPGCFFKITESKRLQFVDYGDPDKIYYDCINAIEKYYNLSFYEALNFIKDKFKTADLQGEAELIKKAETYSTISDRMEVKPIQYSPREWTLEDKAYWQPYGISKQQLVEDNVIPIDLFSIMSRQDVWYSSRPKDVTYAYVFPNKRIKIYSPLALEKKDKWFTNCLSEDLGNIHKIDEEGDQLIITKSYKDCKVLENLGYKNTIWVQGETQLPPIETVLDLLKRFKRIVIFFDNDTEGISSSLKFKDLLNELHPGKGFNISIPVAVGIKDISDHYKKYGKTFTIQLIKHLLKNI